MIQWYVEDGDVWNYSRFGANQHRFLSMEISFPSPKFLFMKFSFVDLDLPTKNEHNRSLEITVYT